MHVVLTVNATWNALNFRRPIIAALIQRGHQVTILAPWDHTAEDLVRLGCGVIDLPMDQAALSPVGQRALLQRMTDALRSIAPDIVLGFTPKNNIFGALACTKLGIPFLPNVSGLGTAFLSGRMMRWVVERLYQRAFRGCPIVFFQNGDDSSLFVERGLVEADQVQVLPGSGIDLGHFRYQPLPKSGEAPLFLFVGRILRDKGAREFAAAARLVHDVYPEARFHMLGAVGAPNRSALHAREVKTWVSGGHVTHLGTARDVRPAITAADCIVLPSYREGAPRTLIEGGAMGRPAIATDVPGCRDVVRHGATGLLVRPRDAKDLSQAMVEFINLPQPLRVAMGAAAHRRMVEVYDQAHVVRSYLEAIGALTGQRIATAPVAEDWAAPKHPHVAE